MIQVSVLVVVPFITACICMLFTSNRVLAAISSGGMAISLALSLYIGVEVFINGSIGYGMWYLDNLSAFFLIITTLVATMVAIYSKGYLRYEQKKEEVSPREVRFYYVVFNIFTGTMLLTFAVKSMAVIWMGIGATTLVSAFLVGFHKDEQSTEAAWKYILLCSVGITLALFGVALLYASLSTGGHEFSTLDWPFLVAHADKLDPVLIKFAAVFILLGYGTKMGLAPMHPWLPDAHSQAPTPISAMMSGVLLNCALYGIIRFYMISEITVPGFAKMVLLAFGLLSLIVAAAFILRAKNLKRLLAYSSIENMGLMAIGLGIGTDMALFAVVLQIIAHSLSKPLMFFAAGNVVQAYGTKEIAAIRGVSKTMPYTAFMLAAGTLAIAGAPPFAMFMSEVALIGGAMSAGMFITASVVVLLLIIIFAGLALQIFPMLSGDTEVAVDSPKSFSRAAPLTILLLLAVFFGLFMPDSIHSVLDGIVRTMGGIM